jgi:hypothetical protein
MREKQAPNAVIRKKVRNCIYGGGNCRKISPMGAERGCRRLGRTHFVLGGIGEEFLVHAPTLCNVEAVSLPPFGEFRWVIPVTPYMGELRGRNSGRPGTFDFLGFTHFWVRSRKGN